MWNVRKTESGLNIVQRGKCKELNQRDYRGRHGHMVSRNVWKDLLCSTTTTTKNVRITVLPAHTCGSTLKTSYAKLLYSSTQTLADGLNRQRQVTRITDDKHETCVSLQYVKSEEQARVSGGRLFHARAAATGKAWSPRVARRVDGTCSVMVSAEQRQRRSLMSAAGCRTSTPVLCHAYNGTPEHTTGIGFPPGRAISEAPVAICSWRMHSLNKKRRRTIIETSGHPARWPLNRCM